MLVICEKPSVASDVAKAMSAGRSFSREPWGYRSSDMLVAAAAGHLVAELPPERYDEKFKQWSYEDLPILPERFMYQPRDSRAADRLRQLAALIRDDDVTEVVNACDAGREGELIFKLIVQFARIGQNKTILRAWFSSMTPSAIQGAFAALRPDRDMWPLEAAARCRSEADWFVGMNATRAATCTLGGGRQMLSLGRVQTPTLALIVNRDLEIENFVATDYFCVNATFAGGAGEYAGRWRQSREPGAVDRFTDRAAADEVADRVRGIGVGEVVDVEVKAEVSNPPKLFDLTELQREANRRYGMTAAKTLEAAQACYETHKVLSYPRTDSRFLPSDMEAQVPALLNRVAAADPALAPLVAQAHAGGPPASRIVDDTKISDHHGLVPTDADHDLTQLSKDERRIYDLVARRLIAALLPAATSERTTIWTTVGEDLFRTSGVRVVDPGWTVAVPAGDTKAKDDTPEADEEEQQSLPAVTVGEQRQVAKVAVSEHQTKPPARFTEATLLGAMATAGRLVTDEEAAEAMKDSGLGTPATRAATLEKLVSVEYVERQARKLVATAKGRGVIIALGEHPLVSPDMTGEWERRLRSIENGTPAAAGPSRDAFVADVRTFTAEIVAGFEGATPDRLAAGRRKIAPCPVPGCAGTVVEAKRAWGCDTYVSAAEPGCGFIVWKETSSGKVTEAQLRAKINKIASGEEVHTPPTPRVEIADCPQCDGKIVTRARSYGCTSFKGPKSPGCGFTIWRFNDDGSEITIDAALEMIAKGESNARPPAEEIADCPWCKGKVVAREKTFGCNSYQNASKPGCGFTIWRTTRDGETVTLEQALGMIAAATPVADCPRCKGKIVDRGKFWACTSWKSRDKTGCGTQVWKMDAGREVTPEELAAKLAEMVGTKAPRRRSKAA